MLVIKKNKTLNVAFFFIVYAFCKVNMTILRQNVVFYKKNLCNPKKKCNFVAQIVYYAKNFL